MSITDAFASAVHTPAIELTVRWDDVTYTDESARVLSADGIESMDDLAFPHAREATVVLDNTDGRYTPGGTASPIYAWTADIGQSARLRLGYDTATTGGWSTVGTYRVRSIAADPGERTATLVLSDATADYTETLVGITATEGLALGSAASLLVSAAGLGTADYAIDPALVGTAQFAYAAKEPLLSELWQIAIAAGGRVYVDADGVLQVEGRTARRAALRTPVAALRASEVVYRQAASRKSDRPNRLVLSFDDRTTSGTAEPIWVTAAPITVPPAYSATVKHLKPEYQTYRDSAGTTVSFPPENSDGAYTTTTYFYAPTLLITIRPEDRVQWRSNVPIDYASLAASFTANTASGGGGSAIAMQDSESLPTAAGTTVYYHVYPPSWSRSSNLMLWISTDYPGTAFITAGTVSASILRREGGYGVVAADAAALELNGGRVVERQVSSAYLTGAAGARTLASEMLALLSSTRASVDIPDIDGVPFLQVGDAFTYIDDTVTPEVTYELQVLENRWTYRPEGGYTASLVTLPALGASDRALATSIPAPATAVGTVVRTGPFHWGADGTALYWSQGTWG